LPFWNEYILEKLKKWWLLERFAFNYLFALIYCFFEFKLVEWIFEKNGTQLMILGMNISPESSEAGELAV
jgi:hypothetical protein